MDMKQNDGHAGIRLKAKTSADKKIPISVRLDADIALKIDELTASSGYKRSEIINTLLRETVFTVDIVE
ncbi:MAG: hypothetical protein OWT28_08270 [Firmicutes bacterium]|nr:hypothetical protein [Bacillota bacterium]